MRQVGVSSAGKALLGRTTEAPYGSTAAPSVDTEPKTPNVVATANDKFNFVYTRADGASELSRQTLETIIKSTPAGKDSQTFARSVDGEELGFFEKNVEHYTWKAEKGAEVLVLQKPMHFVVFQAKLLMERPSLSDASSFYKRADGASELSKQDLKTIIENTPADRNSQRFARSADGEMLGCFKKEGEKYTWKTGDGFEQLTIDALPLIKEGALAHIEQTYALD